MIFWMKQSKKIIWKIFDQQNNTRVVVSAMMLDGISMKPVSLYVFLFFSFFKPKSTENANNFEESLSSFVKRTCVCVCVCRVHVNVCYNNITDEYDSVFYMKFWSSLYFAHSLFDQKKQTCLNCEYIFFWHRVFSSSLFLFFCRACHVFDSFTS